jgi:dienelactone hydrolase
MGLRSLGGLALLLAIAGFGTPVPAGSGQAKAEAKAAEPKKVPCPYATDHAKPLEPKEDVVKKADDHTLSRVEFNGIKGDRVPAYLYVPKHKDPKAPFPAILLQYGSGGNKTTDYIVAVGKQFVARGYVVLTIDAPNQGERRNKDKNPAALSLMSTEMVMHYCGDYSRAVDFLASRREVDKDRLGFVGISWGAITGITYVAYDPRIRAMGSMVGGGNFLGLFTAKLAEKIAAEGSKSSDPVCHVARIAPRPLLFINVTKDQLIPRLWAESLHKAAGAGSKVVWLETDHYFKSVDRSKVCESVIDFMDENLAPKKPVVVPKETIKLFNGKDLTSVATWLKDTKRDDPRKVFTVKDGELHVSGDGFGYVATKKEYRDYHLIVEYKWGKKTDGGKHVRNSGILLHATGPDGGAGGTWMSSIECQLAQGCVGDLIVIRGKDSKDETIPVSLKAETALGADKRPRWKARGEVREFTKGQLWWSLHEAGFKELLDTRGKDDVESSLGAWTKVECICAGKTIEIRVNGTTVNKCFDAYPAAGKILLQSEGFEISFRRFEMQPVKE